MVWVLEFPANTWRIDILIPTFAEACNRGTPTRINQAGKKCKAQSPASRITQSTLTLRRAVIRSQDDVQRRRGPVRERRKNGATMTSLVAHLQRFFCGVLTIRKKVVIGLDPADNCTPNLLQVVLPQDQSLRCIQEFPRSVTKDIG